MCLLEGASVNEFLFTDSKSSCLDNVRVKNDNLKVFKSAMEC